MKTITITVSDEIETLVFRYLEMTLTGECSDEFRVYLETLDVENARKLISQILIHDTTLKDFCFLVEIQEDLRCQNMVGTKAYEMISDWVDELKGQIGIESDEEKEKIVLEYTGMEREYIFKN